MDCVLYDVRVKYYEMRLVKEIKKNRFGWKIMVYIVNLLFLLLDEILIFNGYKYKVEKLSKNNLVFYNEYDIIKGMFIVLRKFDGSYYYFNIYNDEDKGMIIVFCKNCGLDFIDLIKNRDDLEISDKLNYKYNNFKFYIIIIKE